MGRMHRNVSSSRIRSATSARQHMRVFRRSALPGDSIPQKPSPEETRKRSSENPPRLPALLIATSEPMERHYDVGVVGGGPAGAWLARELAGKGIKTLLCERSAVSGEPNFSTAGMPR